MTDNAPSPLTVSGDYSAALCALAAQIISASIGSAHSRVLSKDDAPRARSRRSGGGAGFARATHAVFHDNGHEHFDYDDRARANSTTMGTMRRH